MIRPDLQRTEAATSAARNESEARLRRQLQHNIEKLERSERPRTELENILVLYQDVLAHRDQRSTMQRSIHTNIMKLSGTCQLRDGVHEKIPH